MTKPLIEGKLRYIDASATSVGAGDISVSLRPDAGKVWKVLWADAYQDDGARSVWWGLTDPDDNGVLTLMTATGANKHVRLGRMDEDNMTDPFSEAPIVTYNRYFAFHVDASAAAKNVYLRAAVIEYMGIESTL